MLDYDFYVNTYLGTAIPESAFPGAVVRAAQALQKIRRQYQILNAREMSEKLALCAMAEAIYSYHSCGVSAATVGSVSVRYDKKATLQQQLLEKAKIYLDIYRGGTPWNVR